ncbi:MAG: PQQ-binding-like beta-propeller repeat protein, partial [Planctomycetia bacterium]
MQRQRFETSGRLLAALLAGVVSSAATPSVVPSAALAQSSRAPGSIGVPDKLELDKLGLTRRWYNQLPLQERRESIKTMLMRDGLLFAESDQGLLHCMDAETGEKKWTTTVGAKAKLVFPPSVVGKFIYVTADDSLQQIDRA